MFIEYTLSVVTPVVKLLKRDQVSISGYRISLLIVWPHKASYTVVNQRGGNGDMSILEALTASS